MNFWNHFSDYNDNDNETMTMRGVTRLVGGLVDRETTKLSLVRQSDVLQIDPVATKTGLFWARFIKDWAKLTPLGGI